MELMTETLGLWRPEESTVLLVLLTQFNKHSIVACVIYKITDLSRKIDLYQHGYGHTSAVATWYI